VKWLDSVKNYSDKNISICLVANKIDLVESGERPRAVTETEITDFCVDHGLAFKETSAITGHNVFELFNDMLESRE
jgi:GTPase SAR1 family protein